MLIEKTLKDYIYETSSGSPTPGGGSVAALAGSLGSALTQMVGNLTFDKKSFAELDNEKKKDLQDSFELLKEKMQILTEIVDEDSKAFDGVMTAFKMPQDTEKEKSARSKAIEEGYKHALEVPLRCANECLEVLDLQLIFAKYGNVNTITDVGVGALLAYTGLEGALMNVRINLKSIKDQDYKSDINQKVNTILKDGNKKKEDVLKLVYEKL